MRFPALLLLFCLTASAWAQGSASDLERLTRELLEGSRDQRREAAYALSQLGPAAQPALDALIKALDDRDPQVWFYAIDALANIGPGAAKATDKLIADLARGNRQRWYRSAYALGRIGQPAFEKLRQALKAKDERIRSGAALALSFQPALARAAAKDLVDLLGDQAEAVRHQAVLALGAAGPDVKPLVLEAARKGNTVQRAAAFEVLARWRSTEADVADAIITALKGDDPIVRESALRCLADLRLPPNEPLRAAVLELLLAQDEAVRWAAMDVVVAYGSTDPDLVAGVAGLLDRANDEQRELLVALLERLGPAAAAAVQELIDACAAAADDEQRRLIAEALVAIGPAALEGIQRAIQSKHEAAPYLVTLLPRFGQPARELIIQLCGTNDAPIRAAALRALTELRGDLTSARNTVLRAAHDRDPQVRAAALLAVEKLAREGVISRSEAAQLGTEGVGMSDPAVRLAASRLVVAFADEEVATQWAVRVLSDRQAPAALVNQVASDLTERRLTNQAIFSAAAERVQADPEGSVAVLAYLAEVPTEGARQGALEAVVRQTVGSSDSHVRALTARLLSTYWEQLSGDVRWAVLKQLLEDQEENVRLAALNLLGAKATGDERAAELAELVWRLATEDDSEGVRSQALRLYARLASRDQLVRRFAKALEEEPSWAVRKVLYEELGALGRAAAPAMPAILQRLANTRDDMADALRAVRRIRAVTREAEPILIELLRRRDRARRITAAVLLGELDPPPARPELIPLLEEAAKVAPQGLRQRIQQTIRRIRQASSR